MDNIAWIPPEVIDPDLPEAKHPDRPGEVMGVYRYADTQELALAVNETPDDLVDSGAHFVHYEGPPEGYQQARDRARIEGTT